MGKKEKNILKPEKSLMRRAAKQFICYCFITKDPGQKIVKPKACMYCLLKKLMLHAYNEKKTAYSVYFGFIY